ncbi:ABC transporter ATP-binding protein [Aphanothece sacrum]|uniref:ATP-binding protein of ABC transporter n=1 Tax=Aphanothece sacrum FPU1 TaxID=1920663 RepID=A0A401IMR8_APHSA|nr:ABC transporter ATP-binding protein [Aphanothece sacrum]GBF82547.1 ATP-binding protein of ABC transporter [Aphanothece sacrum FPU1]GBF84681.1 ABC transporter ATP-binding protein [Aphanothece sacrum FPU3]
MVARRLKQLGKYLLPHWRNITLGMVSLLLVNGLGVYIPLLIRDSIDDLRQAFSFDQVLKYVGLILILASIMLVIRMVSRLLIFGLGRQVEFELKQGIFEHILSLEPAYFSTHTSGDLINRATSDVDNIRRLVGFALLSIINTIFAYALTLPAMFSIDLNLSLLAVTVYPLMLITVQVFSRKLQEQQLAVQENLSDISELIQEDMSGMALIKIYAQEDNERRAFALKNEQLLAANLSLAQIRNLLFPLIEALSYISLLLLLAFGTTAIAKGVISIGDFVGLIILVERLVFPTALLGFTITSYQRGEVSIDRVEAIFQAQSKIQDKANTINLPKKEIKGEITARNLTYTYPGSLVPALKNINFTIYPGETVAIVGPIGSGKSTLANALPRLLDINSQQIFLDGKDITELKLRELRDAIAYVPQDSFLFSTTIYNNICYGDPMKDPCEVELAGKKAQIDAEILNFPQQYQTLVGERGITLSGGQRQRTALARALLMDAPILILDDALSSVDNKTATNILENFSREQNKTVIFISHQLSAAAQTDRLFVMDNGEIVQMGTHETLVKQPGLYQNLWKQHQLE